MLLLLQLIKLRLPIAYMDSCSMSRMIWHHYSFTKINLPDQTGVHLQFRCKLCSDSKVVCPSLFVQFYCSCQQSLRAYVQHFDLQVFEVCLHPGRVLNFSNQDRCCWKTVDGPTIKSHQQIHNRENVKPYIP